MDKFVTNLANKWHDFWFERPEKPMIENNTMEDEMDDEYKESVISRIKQRNREILDVFDKYERKIYHLMDEVKFIGVPAYICNMSDFDGGNVFRLLKENTDELIAKLYEIERLKQKNQTLEATIACMPGTGELYMLALNDFNSHLSP
jgi:hypothetical protein